MADIQINLGAENLDDLKKLFNELLKTVTEIEKRISKLGTVTEDDANRAKRLTAEAKKLDNEIKKQELASQRMAQAQERQNQKLSEQKGIIGGLEQEVKKYRSAWKSAQDQASKKTAYQNLQNVKRQLDQAKESTNQWGKALGSFQFKFNALGNIAANALSQATMIIKQFLKDSIQLYNTQAQAENSLLVALKGNAKAQQMLIRQAKELQKVTLFGDEATIQAQAMLAAFIKNTNQIKILTPLLQDMAVAQKMDLVTAGQLLAKTLGSSTNALSRYGIEVKGDVGSTERFSSLIKGLSDHFEGQAKAAALVGAGPLIQIKNQLNDLGEEIGKNLLPVVVGLAKGLLGITDAVKFVSSHMTAFNIMMSKTYKIAEEVSKQYEGQASSMDLLLKKIDDFKIAHGLISSFLVGIKEIDPAFKDADKAVEDFTNTFSDSFDEIIKKQQENAFPWFDIYKEKQDKFLKDKEEFNNTIQELEKENSEALQNIIDQQQSKYEKDQEDKRSADILAAKKQSDEKSAIREKEYQYAMQLAESLYSFLDQKRQNELTAAENEAQAKGWSEQQLADKKNEINKKYGNKEKALSIAEATMGTAVAVTNALKLLPNPAAFVLAALATAIGGVQIATIASQKFAKGEIDIKGRSHNQGGIPAEIEGGESVINKYSTRKYKNLLEGINEDNQLKIALSLNQDRRINLTPKADVYMHKLLEQIRDKPTGYQTKEYYVIREGNKTIMINK